jgi:uncharacterized protein YdhG (YjbR/CyaY superfamily)
MAKTAFKSVDEYIASKPRNAQIILKRVRGAIRKAIPGVEEAIAYQLPMYKLNGVPVLYFAGWKQHYSLSPAGALIAAFRDELQDLDLTKGTIRFPFSEPVPVRLIERIAKFRAEQLTRREKGRGRKKGREAQLARIRRICAGMPSMSEKLSHGTPTFFVKKDKGVFATFTDSHHEDGRLAVWLPAKAGMQSALIEDAPDTYFKPPYVGVSGWIGIRLDQVSDDVLAIHVREAWEIAARGKK